MNFVSGVLSVLLGLFSFGCELFQDESNDGISMDTVSTWIPIEGGYFDMGDEHVASAYPVHIVHVPTFNITRTEITVAQYSECVAAGGCTEPGMVNQQCNWNRSGLEQHPINCVSWNQAV